MLNKMTVRFVVLTISTDEFDKLPHRSMPGVLSEKPMPSTALPVRAGLLRSSTGFLETSL